MDLHFYSASSISICDGREWHVTALDVSFMFAIFTIGWVRKNEHIVLTLASWKLKKYVCLCFEEYHEIIVTPK